MFLLVTLLLIRYEGYLLYQWSTCYSLGKFFVLLECTLETGPGQGTGIFLLSLFVVHVVERSERDMHILSILCLRSWEHILGHSMPTWLREPSLRARSHAQFSGLDSYLWVSLQTLESPLPHWAYLCVSCLSLNSSCSQTLDLTLF